MLRKDHAIHFDNVTTFRNLKQASEAVKSFIHLFLCKGALIFVHIKAELVNMLHTMTKLNRKYFVWFLANCTLEI